MSDLEKQYAEYRNELRKLNEQKDAWYTIASQKFSECDKEGQMKAYAEIDRVQEKIDALVNPLESELLSED
jgi:uncharacterized protein YPO0396